MPATQDPFLLLAIKAMPHLDIEGTRACCPPFRSCSFGGVARKFLPGHQEDSGSYKSKGAPRPLPLLDFCPESPQLPRGLAPEVRWKCSFFSLVKTEAVSRDCPLQGLLNCLKEIPEAPGRRPSPSGAEEPLLHEEPGAWRRTCGGNGHHNPGRAPCPPRSPAAVGGQEPEVEG